MDTNPDLAYTMLIKGQDLAYNTYGIANDYSMVIDREGIIRYVKPSVTLAEIQSTINGLLATTINDEEDQPIDFQLFNNYPNPFNPETTIRFNINHSQKINLNIYNAQGRLINQLINRQMQPGEYAIKWNGTDSQNQKVASGIYFYQLSGNKYNIVKKMQFIK
jgi:hypothetical protein